VDQIQKIMGGSLSLINWISFELTFASGACNMFDLPRVQEEAYKMGFYELVVFLNEHKKEYAEFILTGKR